AKVHVSLEQGHHACFLVVDDAGLRMDDERLMWASDVMSGEQRDDITRLGAHPQTGLRVASLLAEEDGFRVELTAPNLYQGTRAMLVLPKSLLTAPESDAPAAAAPSVPAPAAEPRPEPAPAPGPAPAATTASGLTVRRRASAPPQAPRTDPPPPTAPGRPAIAAAGAQATRRSLRTEPAPDHDEPEATPAHDAHDEGH